MAVHIKKEKNFYSHAKKKKKCNSWHFNLFFFACGCGSKEHKQGLYWGVSNITAKKNLFVDLCGLKLAVSLKDDWLIYWTTQSLSTSLYFSISYIIASPSFPISHSKSRPPTCLCLPLLHLRPLHHPLHRVPQCPPPLSTSPSISPYPSLSLCLSEENIIENFGRYSKARLWANRER